MANETIALIDPLLLTIKTIVSRLQFYIGGIFGLTLVYLIVKFIWDTKQNKQMKLLRKDINKLSIEIQELKELSQKHVKTTKISKTAKAKK